MSSLKTFFNVFHGLIFVFVAYVEVEGYTVAQLVEALRYSRKDAGSIPDGVIGTFH